MNAITLQRWLTNEQRVFVEKFLYPVTRREGVWLIYETDDVMGKDDIPLYNRGRGSYQRDDIQSNIKFFLEHADIVQVSTTNLKEYYSSKYQIPIKKIFAIPNLLPKWWIGDRFHPEEKLKQFKQNKSKPRIGVISSLSHYNLNKVLDNDCQIAKDDFDVISDVIKRTVDDFQWVIFGHKPYQLKSEIENNKVRCFGCSPIISYPSVLAKLEL